MRLELPHFFKPNALTKSERKIWQAAATGTVVDLRVGNPELDSPEKGTEWGTERTIRAEVIADLLIGDGEAATVAVRGVRVQGARITGDLNLEATTLRCPLALLDCSLASDLILDEATALSVRLSGSHVPVLHARQLLTRGDFRLAAGFSVSGGVELAGAHTGGVLGCRGGHFSNPDGPALSADGLSVDGGMFCREGFAATGVVSLLGAHIGGPARLHRGPVLQSWRFGNQSPGSHCERLTAHAISRGAGDLRPDRHEDEQLPRRPGILA